MELLKPIHMAIRAGTRHGTSEALITYARYVLRTRTTMMIPVQSGSCARVAIAQEFGLLEPCEFPH